MSIFEESVEFLDSDIRFHDSQRFEVKLDIELEAPRKSSYEIETYFFVPSALNINQRTYSKTDFYNNLQNFIRFKTPPMDLDKICDERTENSPYNKIKKGIAAIQSGSATTSREEEVYNEIKLLGCASRDYIKGYNSFFIEEVKKGAAGAEGRMLSENLKRLLDELEFFRKKIGELKQRISSPVVPCRIRDAFSFFEEYISIICEENLTSILYALEKSGRKKEFREEMQRLVGAIRWENNFRRRNNYLSYIKEDGENEIFTFRRSALKKFISSALYLKTKVSEWEGVYQVFFGLAAGVAMLFAVIVTIYAQKKYQINSIPFIVLVVVSYIFKDRIKDWLKVWFSKRMTKWFSDRRLEILDPANNNKKIGVLKEAFTFLPASSMPSDILRVRNIDNITSIDEEGKPEEIFKYEKNVKFFPEMIFKFHEEKKSIKDIMRFNISKYPLNADDPYVEEKYMDLKTGEIKSVACARVYHVNVVIKYIYKLGGSDVVNYDRIRIILNKNGIVRIENVKV